MINIGEIKKVYCLGLGGVGVSAVARLLVAQGIKVEGSDPQRNPLISDLERLGVVYYTDELPKRLTEDVDLLVYTDDAPETHPLRQRAKELGILTEHFSVVLEKFMSASRTRMTIAGTNGKSTATAMAGLLLADAGSDPTVFVGSRVAEFDGNVRLGSGPMFVVEADEYRDHFLNYRPTIAVITNVEDDHLDYFGTRDKMLASFQSYVNLVPADGVAVVNADDQLTKKINIGRHRKITFGLSAGADLQAINITTSAGSQSWETFWRGKPLGQFTLQIPGRFNIMNALAAMAAALAAGTDSHTFSATLKKFHGIWRRFQILNPQSATTIVSDYAHHPTAVRVTLAGARKFYPGRRLIAVFQPHHRSRLTSLFHGFTNCFTGAANTMIVETFSVSGRDVPESESKTARQLVAALQAQSLTATYAASPAEAARQLKTMIKPGDVALIMGAGNIWHLAEQLAKDYA